MRSGTSTISTTTGRSPERRNALARCNTESAPNPRLPRSTVAPASPACCAASTTTWKAGRP